MNEQQLTEFLTFCKQAIPEYKDLSLEQIAESLVQIQESDPETFQGILNSFKKARQAFKRGGKLDAFVAKFANGGKSTKKCSCGCDLVKVAEKGGIVEKCACGCKSKVVKAEPGASTDDWHKVTRPDGGYVIRNSKDPKSWIRLAMTAQGDSIYSAPTSTLKDIRAINPVGNYKETVEVLDSSNRDINGNDLVWDKIRSFSEQVPEKFEDGKKFNREYQPKGLRGIGFAKRIPWHKYPSKDGIPREVKEYVTPKLDTVTVISAPYTDFKRTSSPDGKVTVVKTTTDGVEPTIYSNKGLFSKDIPEDIEMMFKNIRKIFK